ncbi:MAG: glycosyltransferase [Rhodospirillales bacterium]|nr:glycosyltransferase [Rhodospirillales bacterium]MDE2459114.1 glycosyltransferase [Rhodospirillales bacterium]
MPQTISAPAGFIANHFRRLRRQPDAVLGKFPEPSETPWFTSILEKLAPEALLIDTIFRVPLVADSKQAKFKRIIVTHDVFYRRAEALKAVGYRILPEGLTRQRETQLLAQAAHIAAIQPEEANLLQEMCPQANVFTAPMPALPCLRQCGATCGSACFCRQRYIAKSGWLQWFFAEIWPELIRHGLTLDLIGDCGPALHKLPHGVNALGRVADLAPLLHRASLAISPLRTGSGLKIKLLDYARHGLFTVATSASLQGFNSDPDAPFIVADGAPVFSETILRHVATPPLSRAAIAYVSRHYNTENAFKGLRTVLDTIGQMQI